MSSSSNSLLSLSTRSTRRKSRKSPQRQLEDDLKKIERRREAYFADPYRLTKPVVSQKEWGTKRQNDSKNPNNVYGLGEYKQGIWKSNRQLQKLLKGSPVELVRNEWREPAGLLNHGATCYVSSLLQCWFFMPALRSAVYQYDDGHEQVGKAATTNSSVAGSATDINASSSQDSTRAVDGFHADDAGNSVVIPEDSNNSADGSFGQQTTNENLGKQMRILQELFARMQLHCAAHFRTEPLLRSLSLSLGVQQDVQEFNKLLLAHLSKTFKTSNKENIQRVVEDVFEGTTCWETKCRECNFASQKDETFLELSVPLHNKESLQDGLDSLFGPEYLMDDNAYMCPQCNKKCEAIRQQKVHRAPPVLNLQLLRFVYDLQTFTKKKLRHQVDFSSELSLPTQDSNTGSACYALTAVIHHHGDSPYSGHYTVDVWDNSRQQWWEIDDESVKPLDDAEDDAKEEKRSRLLPGVPAKRDNQGSCFYEVGTLVQHIKQIEGNKTSLLQRPRPYPEHSKSSSKKKTAYMLVYSRVEEAQQSDVLLPERISPKYTLRSGIQEGMSSFNSMLQKSLERRIQFWFDVLLRRELYRKLFLEEHPVPDNNVDPHLLTTSSSRQYWRWIPTEWLKDWITGMVELESSEGTSSQQKDDNGNCSQNVIDLACAKGDQENHDSREQLTNNCDESKTHSAAGNKAEKASIEDPINLSIDPEITQIDNSLGKFSFFSRRLDPREYLEGYWQATQEVSTLAIPPDAIVMLKRFRTQLYDCLFCSNISSIIGQEGINSLKEQAESKAFEGNSLGPRSHLLEGYLSMVRQAQSGDNLVRSATVMHCTQPPNVILSEASCFNSSIYSQWKNASQRIFVALSKCRQLAQMLEEDSCQSPPQPGTIEYEEAQRQAASLLQEGNSSGGIVQDSQFDVWTLSTGSYRAIVQLSKTLLSQSEEDKLLDSLVSEVRRLFERNTDPLDKEIMESVMEKLRKAPNSNLSALKPVNNDIQCVHNLVRPGKRSWRIISGKCWRAIEQLFNSTPYRVVPGESLTCTTCKEQKDFIKEEKEAEREMREKEIRSPPLSRLWKRQQGHPSGSDSHGLLLPLPTGSYFLVKRPWLQEWRRFVSGTSNDRPEAVDLWENHVCSQDYQERFRNIIGCDPSIETISIPSHLLRFLSDCIRLEPASVFHAYVTDVKDGVELSTYIPADGAERALLRAEEEGNSNSVELVPKEEFLELCQLYHFPGFSEETEDAVNQLLKCCMNSPEYATAIKKLPAPMMHFYPSDEIEAQVIGRRLSSNTDAHVSNANYSIVFDPPLNPFKLDEDVKTESESMYNFDNGTVHVHFLRSSSSDVPVEARSDKARSGTGRKRLRKQDQSEAVPVQRDDTIQLLKMKIMQMFGTDTLGSLFYQGQELMDFETVNGCKIPNGGHVVWRPNKERIGEDQLADKLAESKAYSEQEVGFTGSVLQG